MYIRVHVYDVCARPSLDPHPSSFYSSCTIFPVVSLRASSGKHREMRRWRVLGIGAESTKIFIVSQDTHCTYKCEMNRVREQRVRHGKTPRMIDLTWGISRGETLIHAWNVRVHRSWIVRDDGYVHTVMDTAQRDVRKLHVQGVRICARRTSARSCRILRRPDIFRVSRENQFLRKTGIYVISYIVLIEKNQPSDDLIRQSTSQFHLIGIATSFLEDRRSWSVKDSRNDTRHNWKQLIIIRQLKN